MGPVDHSGMETRREALVEYVKGALWLLPLLAFFLALAAGSVLSLIQPGDGTWLARLGFQGTPDDARSLLVGIAGSVLTVMAVMLGLTVVALQLASTQFSPRLLRNFLQDRPNQIVLAVFVATFTYSTAGLFTVGVSKGERTSSYPALAVSGALVLMFASLGALVFFVHHLTHSIQIDVITGSVLHTTERVIAGSLPPPSGVAGQPVVRPPWAVPLLGNASGYVQTLHPERAVADAAADDVVIAIAYRVGDHALAGVPLAYVWRASPGAPTPDVERLRPAVEAAVRLGFERTHEQDAALGIRQLVDIASKALSPAINDPYTAVQAVDRLTVILMSLARRPLADAVIRDASGAARVVAPVIQFDEYVKLCCAQIRRYGCKEPAVVRRLLLMLDSAAAVVRDDPGRRAALTYHVRLVLADAERSIEQPADADIVREEAQAVLDRLATPHRVPARARSS